MPPSFFLPRAEGGERPPFSVPAVAPGATIISLTLIADEGTDTGPGFIYTDNLNINGQLITKPGAAH